MDYKSPYEITNKMLDLVSSIMEKIGRLDNYTNLNKMPILRRNNRIKSIYSSLAIEENSLSLKEVRDVINNKNVLGPKKEIQEVKNAYEAYSYIKEYNPYSLNDLLKAQNYLTYLLDQESGNFRKGDDGVFDGDTCIFIAPSPKNVPILMNNLFKFLNDNKDTINLLILSSIFHYEMLFIHPFNDSNGRTSRLWQTVILTNYKDIFEYLPIESQIKKYQNEYYEVIDKCNKSGSSTSFIEFMLNMINKTLDEVINTNNSLISSNAYVSRLLEVMDYNIPLSANEIMKRLGIKSKENFRDNYLNPAIENGLVKMTIPDKNTSKNQKYYKV